jgi:hypothetical protein
VSQEHVQNKAVQLGASEPKAHDTHIPGQGSFLG